MGKGFLKAGWVGTDSCVFSSGDGHSRPCNQERGRLANRLMMGQIGGMLV